MPKLASEIGHGERGRVTNYVPFSCRLEEVGRNLDGKVDTLVPNLAWSNYVSQFPYGKDEDTQQRASPFLVPDLHLAYTGYLPGQLSGARLGLARQRIS